MSALPLLLAVGAVQVRVAVPEPEEVDPEEPLVPVEPELPEEPELLDGVVVVDPELAVAGGLLEALAAGEAEPPPPPQPDRISTAAEMPQNIFNDLNGDKRTSPFRKSRHSGKRRSASDSSCETARLMPL